jgi:protein-disulfide isomerase
MEQKTLINLPSAIILSATIIAVALIYINRPANTNLVPNKNTEQNINLPAITKEDYILGNPKADIKIVEYSDPSCPFCKIFHNTMRQVMQQYGASGKVAWVYRHFPLDKPDANGDILHPNAGRESQAFECAGSLGGNDKFWAYVNRLYEITPSVTGESPKGLDPKKLPEIAKEVGLDTIAFNECLASEQFKQKVEKSYLDGINAGVQATPHSVIVVSGTDTKVPIIGAQPFASLKNIIDTILNDKK